MSCRFPSFASVLTVVVTAIVQLAQADWGENNTTGSSAENALGIPLTVDVVSNIRRPGVLLYNRKSESLININYSLNCTSRETVYTIFATTLSERVAKITTNYVFNISCAGVQLINETQDERKENGAELMNQDDVQQNDVGLPPFVGAVTGQVNMTVEAKMIGRTFIILYAQKLNAHESSEKNVRGDEQRGNTSFYEDIGTVYDFAKIKITDGDSDAGEQSQRTTRLPPRVVGKALIMVMQLPRTADEIFRIVLYVAIIIVNTGMGVKVDLVVIKQVFRRPTAPIIGLCCQYICMPLIAFLVAKVVPQESAAVSLGIFTCGIVPGGGLSNMFTYLLDCDLSLSVTMTLMSNIASFALLPMWMFTLGNTFKDDTVELRVPFEKILETMAVFILPLLLGTFIKYKLSAVAKIYGKILKPMLIIVVVSITVIWVCLNAYIFEMIQPMTILAGCILPYIGYLLGGFIAFLCCRSWTHIITIAIETGIQNTTIALLIMYLSLPPPDNQLATIGPSTSGILTPLPLLLAVFLYILYKRCTKKRSYQRTNVNGTNKEDINIDNKECKIVAKASVRDETAAVVIIWQKLKGREPPKNVLEEMLN